MIKFLKVVGLCMFGALALTVHDLGTYSKGYMRAVSDFVEYSEK